MGNLLGSPVTEKETHRGIIHDEDDEIPFAVSSMQGWRVHMEDAHICQTELYACEESTHPTSPPSATAATAATSPTTPTDETMTMNTITTAGSSGGHDEADVECGQNKKAKMNATTSPHNTPPSPVETPPDSNESPETSPSASPLPSSPTRSIHLPRHSLFAVFDGHGGTYAAQYAGLNFCRVLSTQPAFVQYAHYVQQTQPSATSPTGDDGKHSSLTPAQRAELDRRGLESLETALRDAFVEIDREIYQSQHPSMRHNEYPPGTTPLSPDAVRPVHKEEEDSGSTAVVVLLTPQWIVCANAGDSRSVYSKDRGRSIPLSYDHKPNDEAEETRIQDAGGFVRGGRVEGDLAVSRGLGDFRFKEAGTVLQGCGWEEEEESKEFGGDVGGVGGGGVNGSVGTGPKKDIDYHRARRLRRRDSNAMLLPEDQKVSPVPDIIVQNRNRELDEFVVLACDGIWDVLANHECIGMVADIFQEGESDVGLLCEEVLDMCLIRGSKDNMTALVIKMPAQSIGEEGGGVMERRRIRDEAVAEDEIKLGTEAN